MTNQFSTTIATAIGPDTSPAQLAAILAEAREGVAVPGVNFITPDQAGMALEAGANESAVLIQDDDIVLVLPDSEVVVLLGANVEPYLIRIGDDLVSTVALREIAVPQNGWSDLAQVPRATPETFADLTSGREAGSGEAADVLAGDPLLGLPISPLLDPTDYDPLPPLTDILGAGITDTGSPALPVIGTGGLIDVVLAETDSEVGFSPSQYAPVSLAGEIVGETISVVRLSIANLPQGTTANFGTFTTAADGTLTFTFQGSPSQYSSLLIDFPTDFSTESRIDGPEGDLTAFVSAETSFGDSVSGQFPIRVTMEGDVEIDDTLPDTTPDESTTPTLLIPASLLLPKVTDQDGSESLSMLTLIIRGLPGDASFDPDTDIAGVPAGATLSVVVEPDGSRTVTITMDVASVPDIQSAYEAIQVTIPAYFSTNSRTDLASGTSLPITLDLSVGTDEDTDHSVDTPDDGDARAIRVVDIASHPDITLIAQDAVNAEDADNGDSSGATVSLGIDVAVNDPDGSETEENTSITIVFTGMPDGTTVNGGTLTLDPNSGNWVWTGSVNDAENLTIHFPGDFSGQIGAAITATSPDGSVTIDKTITITPTPDIDFSITELVTAETDAPVTVSPSDAWTVSVSDADGSEVLQTVKLTLNNMPAGVIIGGAGAGAITYDSAAGGTFTFTGTPADYANLTLTFPKDYSTVSPASDGTTITGTLDATSNEGTNSDSVSLRITPEGDVMIDASMPDNVADETNAPTELVPVDLLKPVVTDQDKSESLNSLKLTITGLPGDGSFTVANGVTGLPAGATATLTDGADGSKTLVIELTSGDIAADYAGIKLILPKDFSTANRSDLMSGTSLPINLTLSVRTDEDQILGDDTPIDGEATASRQVDINYQLDMTMTAPATLTGEEDSAPGGGVIVDLGIQVDANDIDGSEDGTTVKIVFAGLPSGATAIGGGLLSNGVWTGTLAEANALSLKLPANYAGEITSVITATSPEGVVSTNQTIKISGTGDILITNPPIETAETDAVVTVKPSDSWKATVTDPDGSEVLETIKLTLNGLPKGVIIGGAGAGTVTYDSATGGTFTFTGTPADYANLTLTFPKDFSTESRSDGGPGTITGTLEAISNEGSNSGPVSLLITEEGDIALTGTKLIALAETDSYVDFHPKDALLPVATDIDGSEHVTNVKLTFNALPSGTLYSLDGVTFVTAPTTLNFDGTLAQYNTLVIRLPADYSTQSPATTLTGTLSATTDEGGSASDTFNVTLGAEGDLTVTGTGAIALTENDHAGVTDEDSTTTNPVQFYVRNAWNAQASAATPAGDTLYLDRDGSESVAQVKVSITGLPSGTQILINGSVVKTMAAGETYSNDTLTKAQYDTLLVRLPDDFSTTSPASTIKGSVTFITNEALLAGETDATYSATNGIETKDFTVTVSSERDLLITTAKVEDTEDLVTPADPLPLNLTAAVTDIDHSESITGITVTFTQLPAYATAGNPVVLTSNLHTYTITGTASYTITVASVAELESLKFTQFPVNYSGVVKATVNVTTNEGPATPTSESFDIVIHPVAEPVIDATIVVKTGVAAKTDASGNTIDDAYIIKEDTSFQLQIKASTPDVDGSESLTTVRVVAVPVGWITTNADGSINSSIFGGEVSKINLDPTKTFLSAATPGTPVGYQTLTITLNSGVTDFTGTVTLKPIANDDRDYATLVKTAGDLKVEVDSLDKNLNLATDTNTKTVSDTIDIDYDAVIDDLTLKTSNRDLYENTTGKVQIRVGFDSVALTDTDGSETINKVTLTFKVATESDNFDITNTNQMLLKTASGANAYIVVTQTGSTADSVTYTVTKAASASAAQFQAAIVALQLEFPQHFSGQVSVAGKVDWSETTTPTTYPGDVETDTTDNTASKSFTTTLTVKPVAESTITLTAFVRDGDMAPDDVTDDSPTSVSGTASGLSSKNTINPTQGTTTDGNLSIAQILELRESTKDGSGPNGKTIMDDQAEVYLGLNASTPDKDGSEELETLTLNNIPSGWLPDGWVGGTIAPAYWSALTSLDGSDPIPATELAKIASITFDATAGKIVIAFVDNVTSFQASLVLKPDTYEDWDPSQKASFGIGGATSVGTFYGGDISAQVETRDSWNPASTGEDPTSRSKVTVDIDVAPINNTSYVTGYNPGNEAVIDATNTENGGTWDVNLKVATTDQDGSETLTTVVIRSLDKAFTVYYFSEKLGIYVPAKITAVHADGTVDWSLSNGNWETLQLRRIPMHTATEPGSTSPDYPLNIDVVTTEHDGGGTGVTHLTANLHIEPVADGGTPSGGGTGYEDQAFKVAVNLNTIDTGNELPNYSSPEIVTVDLKMDGITPEGFIINGQTIGRLPRFFIGQPVDANGDGVYDSTNEVTLTPNAAGTGYSFSLPAGSLNNLYAVGGKDSNVDFKFNVTVTYQEAIDPTETKVGTGTISIDLIGVADTPTVTAQNEDPNGAINIDNVNAMYRATQDDGTGTTNYHRLYAYAGASDGPFSLDQRLTDFALITGIPNGVPDNAIWFKDATELSGSMTEVKNAAGNFDGSESLYYIITGVPAGGGLIGGSPIDATGTTYVFSANQIKHIAFVPPDGVSEVTYYDLTIHAIVVENDADLSNLTPSGSIADMDALIGVAVSSEQFSVVVLPKSGGGNTTCPTGAPTGTPELSWVPIIINEDGSGELQLKFTAGNGFNNITDLINLPGGIDGSLSLAIELPAGAKISASDGGVAYDPVSGKWIVDLSWLIGNASGGTGTLSEHTLTYSPPPQQSSPTGFDANDTFGSADPYDSLADPTFSTVLNNFTCNKQFTSTGGAVDVTVKPVADGPIVTITTDSEVQEDSRIALDLSFDSVDGGERLDPNAPIIIRIDAAHIGGDLTELNASLGLEQSGLYVGDTLLTNYTIVNGFYVYQVTKAQLDELSIVPKNHVNGTMVIQVTATSEDVDHSTATGSAIKTVKINAVADQPIIEPVDNIPVDPETGKPVIEVLADGSYQITMIEDTDFLFADALQAFSPDQDGSEMVSAVFKVPLGMTLVYDPSTTTLINNGDGTYTVDSSEFGNLWFRPTEENARTPDPLDPADYPSTISMQVKLISYELSNGSNKTTTQDLVFQIRPDADLPTVTAKITPTSGAEDQVAPYVLTLTGNTPDPHETMTFQISGIPEGGRIFVGATEVTVTNGVAVIPGSGGPNDFTPSGIVTFIPPKDYSGTVALQVTSITTDTSPIFTDTQPSAPVDLSLTVTPTPDLSVTVTNAAVVLTETDAPVDYKPSTGIQVAVSDTDGSETATIKYHLEGLPVGTTYLVNGVATAVSGTLDLTLTQAEYDSLTLRFPADFATNGTPLKGTVSATTNEGGSASSAFTIAITGTEDVTVDVSPLPTDPVETPVPQAIRLGIEALVNDTQATPSETLEKVVVTFDAPVDAGVIASYGVWSADRKTLTMTRGGEDAATFAAAVAALILILPADYADALSGQVVATTNHGDSDPASFAIDVAVAPDDAPPLWIPDADAETGDTLLPMEDSGETVTHEGKDYALMTNVDGDTATRDVAQATDDDDAVVFDPTTHPYDSVEIFQMQGGDDLVDLSGSDAGYVVMGGDGDDILIGSAGNDLLDGGAGADTLTGGEGADVFRLAPDAPGVHDVITDYDQSQGDSVDLTAFGLGAQIDYDSDTGKLSVDGEEVAQISDGHGGIPDAVVVIFEAAESQAATMAV